MRVVLDTNIWLDWLVFRDASLLHLKKSVADGKAEIVIDAACEAELERVLAYDLARLPKCRDPDDQKFLELAFAAQAGILVTKDHKLLELARRTREFRILAPKKLSFG